MALSLEQRKEVSSKISNGLERAEKAWKSVGHEFVQKAHAMDAIRFDEQKAPSIIPGHPWVTDGTPKVDEFIALVVDMRNSSEHLKSNISSPIIKYGFQRIYYETSALLPAISAVTSFEDGVVTEYLGDGTLALFQVNAADIVETIRSASRVARHCIGEMRELLNAELYTRYKLPAINLGAGLAISKALVTLVGSDENPQPKAIGECVWEATKLSAGVNKIHISERMRHLWPSSKGGKLQFQKVLLRDVPGFRLREN